MPYYQTTKVRAGGDVVSKLTTVAPAYLKQIVPSVVGEGGTITPGLAQTLYFPYGPKGIEYQNFGLEYSQIARPGRKPILQATAQKSRSISFSAIFSDRNCGLGQIQSILDTLETISNQDVDCVFVYGTVRLPYRVRLTSYSYTDIWRDRQGRIVQAEVSVQLDEKVVINQQVVELEAIIYEPPDDHSGDGGSDPEGEEDPPDDEAAIPCGFAAGCADGGW